MKKAIEKMRQALEIVNYLAVKYLDQNAEDAANLLAGAIEDVGYTRFRSPKKMNTMGKRVLAMRDSLHEMWKDGYFDGREPLNYALANMEILGEALSEGHFSLLATSSWKKMVERGALHSKYVADWIKFSDCDPRCKPIPPSVEEARLALKAAEEACVKAAEEISREEVGDVERQG